MAFVEFAHLLWEAAKPRNGLTDSEPVTLFFQTKVIPPTLWTTCGYMLQFTFKIARLAGSMNTAAEILSRIERSKITENNRLKIREDTKNNTRRSDTVFVGGH